MGDSTSPVVERRRLAHELRRLRTERKKTIQEIAVLLECSPGKISRIETATVGARIGDVRDLLDIYEVHGDEREHLLDLVRKSHQRAWWHAYAGILPAESLRFFGLEDGATTIDESSGLIIPGLLQTDDYARALISTARVEPKVSDLRIELRRQRQQLIVRSNPPEITFVVHEAALATLFGGAEVMAAQLDHLVEMSTRPNVTILVFPLCSREYAAAGAAFTIFRFPGEDDQPIVHVEQLTSSVYRERADEVAVYANAFDELRALALGPEQSREIMTQRANSHRKAG